MGSLATISLFQNLLTDVSIQSWRFPLPGPWSLGRTGGFDKGLDDVNVHLEEDTHTLLTLSPSFGESMFCLKQHQI